MRNEPPSENGLEAGERDPVTGRFLPGNKGGPGAPFLDRVARFRRVLVEAVTDEDVEEIARTLVKLSKGGDLAAIKVLLPYLIGKVPEIVNEPEDGGTKGPILIVLGEKQLDGFDRAELGHRGIVGIDAQDVGL